MIETRKVIKSRLTYLFFVSPKFNNQKKSVVWNITYWLFLCLLLIKKIRPPPLPHFNQKKCGGKESERL